VVVAKVIFDAAVLRPSTKAVDAARQDLRGRRVVCGAGDRTG
jgi:hypothetical protein